MRTFIAIDLPESFENNIEKIQREFKKTGGDIKFVDPRKVHITLKFLGEINEELVNKVEIKLDQCLKNIDPFDIIVEDIGVFPSTDYIKVIWLGVGKGSYILEKMNDGIEESLSELGFDKESREFIPHATIGRVKSGKNKEDIVEVVERNRGSYIGEMPVDRVKIKQSNLTSKGPIYSDISEVIL